MKRREDVGCMDEIKMSNGQMIQHEKETGIERPANPYASASFTSKVSIVYLVLMGSSYISWSESGD